MKYMLLIYQGTTPLPPSPEWDALPSEKKREIYAAYGALNEIPGYTPGQRMDGDTATTVRVEDGRTLVTDGPFVELKEAVGGYCFLEADDIDAAIELAGRIPAAALGGAVEIRPLVEQ
jgi:hypothetical protein